MNFIAFAVFCIGLASARTVGRNDDAFLSCMLEKFRELSQNIRFIPEIRECLAGQKNIDDILLKLDGIQELVDKFLAQNASLANQSDKNKQLELVNQMIAVVYQIYEDNVVIYTESFQKLQDEDIEKCMIVPVARTLLRITDALLCKDEH